MDLREQGIDSDRAATAALSNAAIQSVLEQLPMGKILSKMPAGAGIKKKLVEVLKAVVAEGSTEFLQEFPEQLSSIYALHPELNGAEDIVNKWKENAKEHLVEAAYSGLLGGVTGGLSKAGIYFVRKLNDVGTEKYHAMQMARLDEQIKMAEKSNLPPEEIAKSIDSAVISVTGKEEKVSITGKVLYQYAQEKGEENVANALGVSVEEIKKAADNGGDILVSRGNYTAAAKELKDLHPRVRSDISLIEGVESLNDARLTKEERASYKEAVDKDEEWEKAFAPVRESAVRAKLNAKEQESVELLFYKFACQRNPDNPADWLEEHPVEFVRVVRTPKGSYFQIKEGRQQGGFSLGDSLPEDVKKKLRERFERPEQGQEEEQKTQRANQAAEHAQEQQPDVIAEDDSWIGEYKEGLEEQKKREEEERKKKRDESGVYANMTNGGKPLETPWKPELERVREARPEGQEAWEAELDDQERTLSIVLNDWTKRYKEGVRTPPDGEWFIEMTAPVVLGVADTPFGAGVNPRIKSGVEILPLRITYAAFCHILDYHLEAQGKHSQGITLEFVKKILREITDPIAIIRERQEEESFVFLLGTGKQPIYVPVRVVRGGFENSGWNPVATIPTSSNINRPHYTDDLLSEGGEIKYINKGKFDEKPDRWWELVPHTQASLKKLASDSNVAHSKELVNAREALGNNFYQIAGSKDELPLGSIEWDEEGKAIISLFEGRDHSTVFHEVGHYFINSIYQDIRNGIAREQDYKDMNALLKYVGLDSEKWDEVNDESSSLYDSDEYRKIRTDAHEKWAEAFESYLMEGKAPSFDLRRIFERIKNWMLDIYAHRERSKNKIELTDEVRDVFDRMLASRDEIEAAQRYEGYFKALPTVITNNLSETTKRKLMDYITKAKQEAVTLLTKQALSNFSEERRAQIAAYREKRKQPLSEILAREPLYAASAEVCAKIAEGRYALPRTIARKYLAALTPEELPSAKGAAAETFISGEDTIDEAKLKRDIKEAYAQHSDKEEADIAISEWLDKEAIPDLEKNGATKDEIDAAAALFPAHAAAFLERTTLPPKEAVERLKKKEFPKFVTSLKKGGYSQVQGRIQQGQENAQGEQQIDVEEIRKKVEAVPEDKRGEYIEKELTPKERGTYLYSLTPEEREKYLASFSPETRTEYLEWLGKEREKKEREEGLLKYANTVNENTQSIWMLAQEVAEKMLNFCKGKAEILNEILPEVDKIYEEEKRTKEKPRTKEQIKTALMQKPMKKLMQRSDVINPKKIPDKVVGLYQRLLIVGIIHPEWGDAHVKSTLQAIMHFYLKHNSGDPLVQELLKYNDIKKFLHNKDKEVDNNVPIKSYGKYLFENLSFPAMVFESEEKGKQNEPRLEFISIAKDGQGHFSKAVYEHVEARAGEEDSQQATSKVTPDTNKIKKESLATSTQPKLEKSFATSRPDSLKHSISSGQENVKGEASTIEGQNEGVIVSLHGLDKYKNALNRVEEAIDGGRLRYVDKEKSDKFLDGIKQAGGGEELEEQVERIKKKINKLIKEKKVKTPEDLIKAQKEHWAQTLEWRPQEVEGKRLGATSWDEQGRAYIALFQGSNVSTVVHEFGHYVFESTYNLIKDGVATEQTIKDFDTLLKWVGLTFEAYDKMNFEERRECHEKIATAFETYVMEGKAPSTTLAKIFSRLKNLMLKIYKSLTENRGKYYQELNPEVRAVFDRMLACQAEIDVMKRTEGYFSKIPTEIWDTLPDSVKVKLTEYAEKAEQISVDRITKKALEEFNPKRKKAKEEYTKQVREEAAKEVNSQQFYKTLNELGDNHYFPVGSKKAFNSMSFKTMARRYLDPEGKQNLTWETEYKEVREEIDEWLQPARQAIAHSYAMRHKLDMGVAGSLPEQAYKYATKSRVLKFLKGEVKDEQASFDFEHLLNGEEMTREDFDSRLKALQEQEAELVKNRATRPKGWRSRTLSERFKPCLQLAIKIWKTKKLPTRTLNPSWQFFLRMF